MEVHLTSEQEARLAQLATEAGTDAERLVKDIILRVLEAKSNLRTSTTELPVWRLGAVGPFHRRDIYNDVD
jgi:hypothetical protein